MNPVNPDLFNALVAALPFRFLNSLKEKQPQIYLEAYHAAHNDPLLEEPEAEYLMPHYRRAIFEANLRKDALDAGLNAVAQANSRGTAHYTVIQAGNFVATASYLNERGSKVRDARFRSDFSSLNNLLAQTSLEGEGYDIEHGLQHRNGAIYFLFLHGPDRFDRKLPGFMQLAFPDPHTGQWVDVYDFADVFQASMAMQAPQQQDLAKPILKPQQKPKTGGET